MSCSSFDSRRGGKNPAWKREVAGQKQQINQPNCRIETVYGIETLCCATCSQFSQVTYGTLLHLLLCSLKVMDSDQLICINLVMKHFSILEDCLERVYLFLIMEIHHLTLCIFIHQSIYVFIFNLYPTFIIIINNPRYTYYSFLLLFS